MVKIRAHFRQHPEWFFRNWLGVEPTNYQIDIANSVRDNRLTTAASCNSAGKTGISGCLVPWYLLSYNDSIVVTTAPKWQQVKDLLWREINNRWEKAALVYPLSSQKPTVTSWQIAANWYAVGVASKDPSKIQGYHADSGHLLVIADEAAVIDQALFEGIYAIITSKNCRFLMLGNPTSQSGEFHDSFKPGSLFTKIRVSAFDTPNFTANGIKDENDLVEAIESKRTLLEPRPYLISPDWAYERLKKWGAGSPMYQARIQAQFPESGENTLIPLNLIEAATGNDRLEKVLHLELNSLDPLKVSREDFDAHESENDRIRQAALDEYIRNTPMRRGVDVARFGSDRTVIQPRWGGIIGFAESHFREDTMQTAGRVWAQLHNDASDLTNVDVIGLGGGVVDRLNELKREHNAVGDTQFWRVQGVNVAVPALEKKARSQSNSRSKRNEPTNIMEFANKRAELYWKLREAFERGTIYLMPDDKGNDPEDLMDELSNIEYKFLGGKIFIEEKAEMKKRLDGKSPDHADALMLTLEIQSDRWSMGQVQTAPAAETSHTESGSSRFTDLEDDPLPAGMGAEGAFGSTGAVNSYNEY